MFRTIYLSLSISIYIYIYLCVYFLLSLLLLRRMCMLLVFLFQQHHMDFTCTPFQLVSHFPRLHEGRPHPQVNDDIGIVNVIDVDAGIFTVNDGGPVTFITRTRVTGRRGRKRGGLILPKLPPQLKHYASSKTSRN